MIPRTDFLTGIILRPPTMGERDNVFPNNRRGISSPDHCLHSREPVSCIFLWRVVQNPTPIGPRLPPRRNFTGDISLIFSDRENVPLPCLCTIF